MATENMELGRNIERRYAAALTQEVAAALTTMNDRLAELTPAYNGYAYYTTPEDQNLIRQRRGSLVTMFGAEAPGTPAAQNAFYREQVLGHRVALGKSSAGTTLAEHARNPKNELDVKQSLHVPDQLTLTVPTTLRRGDAIRTLGALQVVWDHRYGPITDIDKAQAIIAEEHATLTEVGIEMQALGYGPRPLWKVVNALPPTTPNAFLFRTDVANSTRLALGSKYVELLNYMDDLGGRIETAAEPFEHRTLATGDGQNFVVRLPETGPEADLEAQRYSAKQFGEKAVKPFIARILEAHTELAEVDYKDLAPRLRLSVGLGFVEDDDQTGQVFWETALLDKTDKADTTDKTKTDPTQGQVRYTAAARAALGIND